MSSRMLFSLALASMSLIFATGCSTPVAKKKSTTQTITTTETKEVRAPAVVGTEYTTVFFNKGRSSLDSMSKENLKHLISTAHKSKKDIEEIRILTWADKEYPDKVNGKPSTSEIILASDRAQKIKDYLEEDLKEMEDIDSYNMAKRPNLMSKLLQNDEYKVKEAFETSGATGDKLPDGSVSYTKASKAIVIIDYEGDEDNLK
jgi:hypothetical protein